MTVTLDSSAWIEFFSGSKSGVFVKKYIESNETIYTPVIDLMEIKNKYMRENKNWKNRIEFICERSIIIDVNSSVSLEAATIKKKYGLHTIDALVYASAQSMKSKLITKDHHFKNLAEVIILDSN